MKRFFIFIMLFMLILTGCSKSNDENINGNSDIFSNYDNSYSQEYKPDVIKSSKDFSNKIQLTFVTDFNYLLDENIVNELNKKLDKDGYDFAVSFVNINSDKLSPIDYYEGNKSDVDILMTSGGVSKEIIAGDPDIFTCKPHENTYWECVNKGWFVSLNSYFKTTEGKKLYNTFNKKYWQKAADNSGNIYGLYTSYLSDQPTTLVFDKNVAKEYNYDYNYFDGNISSLEDVLKQIKLKSNSAGFLYSDIKENCCNIIGFSKITDGIYLNENTGKAENIFANKSFEQYAKTMSEFAAKGYLKDIDSVKDNNQTLCLLSNYSPFYANEYNEQIVISNTYQNNNHLNCGVGIVKTSKHIDEAFELLVLLYSDKNYANLITCGIERKNYKIDNKNFAELNNEKPSFYANYDYFVLPANPFIAKSVTTSTGMDYVDKSEKFDKMFDYVKTSKAYGKEIDLSSVKEKLAKISELYNQYNGLFFGKYDDVEASINEANKKLKDAGIDEVLANINSQLEGKK